MSVSAPQLAKIESTEPAFRCRYLQIHAQTNYVRENFKDLPLTHHKRISGRAAISRVKDSTSRAVSPLLDPVMRRSQEQTGLGSKPVMITGRYVLHIFRKRTSPSGAQSIIEEGKVTKAFRIAVLVDHTRLDLFELSVHPLRSRMRRVLSLIFLIFFKNIQEVISRRIEVFEAVCVQKFRIPHHLRLIRSRSHASTPFYDALI